MRAGREVGRGEGGGGGGKSGRYCECYAEMMLMLQKSCDGNAGAGQECISAQCFGIATLLLLHIIMLCHHRIGPLFLPRYPVPKALQPKL